MKKQTQDQSAQGSTDIIDLILEDHVALKELIKILKDTEVDIGERYAAFGEFAPLLTLHAKPEERTLYVKMKEDDELRSEGMEGDVEHALADQLLNEAKETTDEDLWTAKVKVLAELVEHHIEEEEDELLPDYRKNSQKEERMQLGEEFIQLKETIATEDPMFSGVNKQMAHEEMLSPSIH